LIQQRLKQVVVGAINQDNAHRRIPKRLSSAYTAKSSADNNDCVRVFRHNL
jgi:hypothetical protein